MKLIHPKLERRPHSRNWGYRFQHEGMEYRRSTGTADLPEAEAILANLMRSLESDTFAERADARRTALQGEISTTQHAASIGAVGEKLVCIDLMNRGFAVFEAASPASPCDIVFLTGCGRLVMVEVKVGSLTKTGKVDHNKIRPTCEYDVLAVVTRLHGIVYKPSIDDLIPRGRVTEPDTTNVEPIENGGVRP